MDQTMGTQPDVMAAIRLLEQQQDTIDELKTHVDQLTELLADAEEYIERMEDYSDTKKALTRRIRRALTLLRVAS